MRFLIPESELIHGLKLGDNPESFTPGTGFINDSIE